MSAPRQVESYEDWVDRTYGENAAKLSPAYKRRMAELMRDIDSNMEGLTCAPVYLTGNNPHGMEVKEP